MHTTTNTYIMENFIYFALFWILAGLGNYLVFLIELRIKGLTPPKSFKKKVFRIYIFWGFIGVIGSIYLLIFPKK